MKFIEIRKRENGEIWAIEIFDFFIDFRKWYKVYRDSKKTSIN